MLFNTINYFVFLIIVVLGYYVLPKKVCYIWLLTASYYFYMQWNAKYALLLLFSTLITYLGALVIGCNSSNKHDGRAESRKKLCLYICIIANLLLLFFFKYFNFVIYSMNIFISKMGSDNSISFGINVILPVGISFYILQALGYLIDVYREDIKVEKNFFRYSLFVSFFPQLVAGPIERSGNLLKQLRNKHTFKYCNFQRGFYYVMYGLFLKMVIADKAAVIVNTVFGDLNTYGGLYIIFATILFSIQIYCDFYGYSLIAKGSALFLGIHLMDNFNAPYFSRSIKEFWTRWHISLSSWLRDYIYIPLGGNQKGKIRTEINRIIVFFVSGLWHGAAWNYVLWGLLHAFYQTFSNVLNLRTIIDRNIKKHWIHVIEVVITTCLVIFAWLFFRANGLSEAVFAIRQSAQVQKLQLFELGLDEAGVVYLFVSVIVLLVIDYMKYRNIDVMEKFMLQKGWIRYIMFLYFFVSILLFGYYGETNGGTQFIYFQF